MTLEPSFEPFDVGLFLQLLRHRGSALGEPFSYLDRTHSTNDVAKQAARTGAPSGATFLTDHQSAGRGRRGRTWHSEPGQGLLFSVVLDSSLPPERLSPLTLAVGLGVREALAEFAEHELSLKWPNDVLFEGRKLAGVLVESEASGNGMRLVVGVGVNVGTPSFPAELASIATSLRLLGCSARREHVLARALPAVHHWIATLERGDLSKIVAEVSRFDALAGKQVLVEGVRGIARGIDAQGQLLVQVGNQVRAVRSGTVEIQR